MKTIKCLTLMSAVLMVFCTFSTVSYAQDEEPDLSVSSSGISFNPGSPVRVRKMVRVQADVYNVENCYIILGKNGAEVGYSYSFTGGDIVKIKARMRSPSGSNIGVQGQIGDVPTTTFYCNSTGWDDTAESIGITVPFTNNDTLYFTRISSGGYDLEIDWIEVYKFDGFDWEPLFKVEAEAYDEGGGSVDAIYPSNVKVSFYDGDPDGGGSKIGSTQTIGNVSKTTESGTVKILTENAKATATVYWQAKPVGWHKIYAKVTPDPREVNTSNNKAYKSIQVVPFSLQLFVHTFIRLSFF